MKGTEWREERQSLAHSLCNHIQPQQEGRLGLQSVRWESTEGLGGLFDQLGGSSYIQQETSSSFTAASSYQCTNVIKTTVTSQVQIKKVQKKNHSLKVGLKR